LKLSDRKTAKGTPIFHPVRQPLRPSPLAAVAPHAPLQADGYETIAHACGPPCSERWSAGFFALAAAFSIELRRDRRRQIAAARLVLAEFSRAELEILVVASRVQSWQAKVAAGLANAAAWIDRRSTPT
jgi:hypothetical protein